MGARYLLLPRCPQPQARDRVADLSKVRGICLLWIGFIGLADWADIQTNQRTTRHEAQGSKEMKKIHANKKMLLGMYLLLRQTELSLHRLSGGDWPGMVKFFADRSQVLDGVHAWMNERLARAGYQLGMVSADRPASSAGIHNRLFTGKFLSDEELAFIVAQLRELRDLLKREEPPAHLEMIRFREQVCHGESLVASKLTDWDTRAIDCVVHYDQNERLVCFEIDQLLGNDWLIDK